MRSSVPARPRRGGATTAVDERRAPATEARGPAQAPVGDGPPAGAGSEPTSRGGRLDRTLAGLTIASLPLGNIAYESDSRSLLISYSLFVGAVLILHVLIGTLARRRQAGQLGRALRIGAGLLLAMFIPVIAGGLQTRSIVAYVSFAGGTLSGLAIGAIWATRRERLGFLDGCLMFFVLATAVQLRLSLTEASSVHQAEVTWGASNYVAGTLVVASLAIVARLLETRRHLWLWAVPAIGCGAALLTLSRGAAVALAVGLLVLLWNSGRTRLGRAALRLGCLGLVVGAIQVFGTITAARSVGGYDPSQNISARIELLQLAWDQFLSSPFTGTGWLTLRDVGDFAVPISFAHNVILSFLQIGGLCGLLYLVVSGRLVRTAWRGASRMFAAVAAAVAISLSDPFFEGGVGSLIAWSALTYAAFSARHGAAAGLDVRTPPERGATVRSSS